MLHRNYLEHTKKLNSIIFHFCIKYHNFNFIFLGESEDKETEWKIAKKKEEKKSMKVYWHFSSYFCWENSSFRKKGNQ